MLPNITSLRMYFNGKLKAAVDELFGAFEKTITEHSHLKQENYRLIAEHREKMSRVEEENVRLHRLLDLVLKPEIKIHRLEDLQQLTLSVSEEVRPEEDQRYSESEAMSLEPYNPTWRDRCISARQRQEREGQYKHISVRTSDDNNMPAVISSMSTM
ncbi:hypothetical protein UPYG_G00150810 [Umbra pygmaea]|uniref:Uncharacterized protein n=1 Tax=Umbra pygmaea TaxID=75934 RepID=A0ABD0XLT9_UMBPY